MAIMATGIVTMKSEVKAVEKVQVTTTYGLYVHNSMSTDVNTRIGSLFQGELVNLYAIKFDAAGNQWYQIYYNGSTEAYVKAIGNENQEMCKLVGSDEGEDLTTPTSTTTGYEIRVVATYGENVYQTASTYSTKVGFLNYGSVARKIGETEFFYKVRFRSSGSTLVTGYVAKRYSKEYLNKSDSSAEIFKKLSNYNGIVMSSAAQKVHVSPSTSSGVLVRMKKGTMLTITGYSKNWYIVSYVSNGSTKTGFMYKGLMKKIKRIGVKKINKTRVTVKRKKTTQLYVKGLNCVSPIRGTWVSNNRSVASVDTYTGVVKGVRRGSAVITGKIGTMRFKCVVSVK